MAGGGPNGDAGTGAGAFAGVATASVILTSGSCSALSEAQSAGRPTAACPANSNARTALISLLLRGGGRSRRHVEGDARVHHLLPRLIAPRHRLGRIRVRLVVRRIVVPRLGEELGAGRHLPRLREHVLVLP